MKDSERKRRFQVLLERNQLKNEEKETSVLFEECLGRARQRRNCFER